MGTTTLNDLGIDAEAVEEALSRDMTFPARWYSDPAIYAFELDRFELAGSSARGILTHTDDPARVGPAVWVLALGLMARRRFEEALSLLRYSGDRAGIPEFWRARNDAVRSASSRATPSRGSSASTSA